MNSTKGNANKSEMIMDVNQAAVESQMLEHAVKLLIHGHTHRTAIHSFTLKEKNAYRIVLGDWYTTGNYLHYENRNFSLRNYPDDKELADLVTL
jgi:UDP-2,3-diacylglucosamine hydrolase